MEFESLQEGADYFRALGLAVTPAHLYRDGAKMRPSLFKWEETTPATEVNLYGADGFAVVTSGT